MAFLSPTANRGARSVAQSMGSVSGTQLDHGVVILPSVGATLLLVQQKHCMMPTLCRRGSKAGQVANGPFKLLCSFQGCNPDPKIHVARGGTVMDGELQDHAHHIQEAWPCQEVFKGEARAFLMPAINHP